MKTIRELWGDRRGHTSAMALVLLTTIVALGAIVGITSLRDQIVQEMGDIAVALESLDQSFSGPLGTFADPGTALDDPAGAEPACLSVQISPSPEG